jgi:cytochrome c-type biogenesis protein
VVSLFSELSRMLQASATLALVASFLWGIFSVVLSPCNLAGVPLLVGHIARTAGPSRSRAGGLALLFASGILVTLVLIGFVTAQMGRLLGDTGKISTTIVGGFLVLFGLSLVGLVRLPSFDIAPRAIWARNPYLQSCLLGLRFGLALGPCSFAFLAPMLAVAFEVSRTRPLLSVSLYGAYALGHTAVIVLAGILSGAVGAYLRWNEKTRAAARAKAVLGCLVVLGGAYLILSTWVL